MKSKSIKSTLKLYTHTAVAALLVGMTGAAQAQTSDTIETVTVTGFRASLANALEKKQTSNLMMEAVSPEDIGKMPDKDVAESLQRLPGVQIDRTSGEGTAVRIRGLSYNVTLLDDDIFVTGREMYSTGEGSGAGNNNEYQNSLEGIPSSLISGIDVYKSPKAGLVAGALGGTIILHTRNALEGKDGLTIGGNIGGTYSQGTSGVSPGGAIVAAYKFNSQLGVIASLSYDEHSVLEYEAQGGNRGSWVVAGPVTGVDNTIGKNVIEPELFYMTHKTVDRKRFGAFLGVNYNPIDSIQTSLTWFHSKLNVDRRDSVVKLFTHSNNESFGLDPTKAASVDDNGVLLKGTFLARSAENATMVEEDKNIADNIQANVKFDNGGKFRGTAKFSYGKGTLDSEFAQMDVRPSAYGIDSSNGYFNGNTALVQPNGNYANPLGCGGNGATHIAAGANSCSFTYTNTNGMYPNVQYTIPDLLSNPNYYLFKSAWAWNIKSKNTQWSARVDGEYDLLPKVTLSGGLRYANKIVDYDFGRYLLNAYGNGTCSFTGGGYVKGGACPGGQGQLSWEGDQAHRGPWTYYQDPSLPNVPVVTFVQKPGNVATIKNFFPAAGMGTVVTQNADVMASSPSAWLHSVNPNLPMQRFKDAINSFKIGSKVTEGYFMLDIGEPADGFHINTGVRVVHTQLDIGQYSLAANPKYISTATWNGLPDITATTYGVTKRQYTDILPSLNAVFDVGEGQKVRFAAARVMAEMNYWQLGAGKYNNFTHLTSGRCNVNTNPAGATLPTCLQEGFYFVSGNGGNNQLDPYRANQLDLAYEYYFGKQGLLSVGLFWKGVDSFVQQITTSVTVNDDFGGTQGSYATFVNGRGGFIEGVEINAQYAFENGFGFNANYTYAKSRTANATAFSSHLGFPGVAQNAYTLQGYYESGPFAGRVSYTWKGSSLAGSNNNITFAFPSLAGGATKTYGLFDRAYGQVDAQLSYQVFENIGVVLEGRNLTGSSTSTYMQYKNQPYYYDQSGRSYGISVKFDY